MKTKFSDLICVNQMCLFNPVKDDELDEETKSYLAQDEDAILSSPKGSTSSKSPENPPVESSTGSSTAPPQAKKVVLKRKLLSSISLTDSEPPKTNTEIKVPKIDGEKSDDQTHEEKPSNGASADGNVVKLSQLTMKERLELRAKKFGATPTGDVAKLARAERFGTVTATASTAIAAATATATIDSSTVQKAAPNVDLLKKRAERFGGSVSNTMVKIEEKQKLLKRQERFGNASTAISGTVKTTTAPISTEAANDYAEKAKQRLERFKTAV